jgi:putative cell wall-binding protein
MVVMLCRSVGLVRCGRLATLGLAASLAISASAVPAPAAATPNPTSDLRPQLLQPASSTVLSRIGGSDRFSTAAQIADRGFLNATEAIVVSGRSFADGLVASSWSFGIYPILLVEQDQVPTATRTRLASMHNLTMVRVIGGPAAISDDVVAQIGAIAQIANPSAEVERVWGSNRYLTAVAVANLVADSGVPAPMRQLVMAVGADFPDALAAGALAAGLGYPMLLTSKDRLRNEVRTWMTSRADLTEVIVVGGAEVITDAVLAEINSLRNRSGQMIEARRLSGANRFETAVAVANEVISKSPTAPNAPSRVVIVNGRDFPDALAAGPLAGRLGVPILLVQSDRLPNPTRAWLATHAGTIFEIAVIGGRAVISDEVASQARSAATR